MGIKNLTKFLTKNCGTVFVPRSLAEYSGKRIAVDITLYVWQFKTRHVTRWIHHFLQFVLALCQHGIHPVFIYDTCAPELKAARIQERKARRSHAESRIQELRAALAEWETTGTERPILRQTMEKAIVMTPHGGPHIRLAEDVATYDALTSQIAVERDCILEEIGRLEKQVIYVTRSDLNLSRELLASLGLPYIDSPTEAETLASQLCVLGHIDAVLSADSDVLVYGTPIFLTKLGRDNMSVVEIRIDQVLQELGLTLEQFRDFCILCGTDYNSNIFRVGSEKSFRLIKKYGSIEAIAANEPRYDITPLHHEHVREIFQVPATLVVEPLVRTTPNFRAFAEWLEKSNASDIWVHQFMRVL